MTAARKLWTPEHQRQLKAARLEAGVSDVAFARDNAIALRHLQQLEEGGSSAFYSDSIKYDMGAKLLKRLGVEPHVATVAPAEPQPEPSSAPHPAVAAAVSPPVPDPSLEPVRALAPAHPDAPADMSRSGTRLPYIVLSLVGLGLIGAGISLIPSIHQPGATQGVVQTSGAAPAVATLSTEAQPLASPGGTPGGEASMTVPRAAEPATMTAQPALAEPCQAEGTPQTIVPSQPSKSADYVYVTAVSDVTVCVRDAAGQVTRKSLQAGQSFNIPGRQPFEVTADQLHQLRVFFQGQRIWFQAEATRLRLTAATASD